MSRNFKYRHTRNDKNNLTWS